MLSHVAVVVAAELARSTGGVGLGARSARLREARSEAETSRMPGSSCPSNGAGPARLARACCCAAGLRSIPVPAVSTVER